MPSPAPASHLPSELLLSIFGFLDHADLYTLTQASPRFSHLSLICYFARRGVSIAPDGRVDLPNAPKTMEMLPFLRKARFITSINRLSCGIIQPHRLLLENISCLVAVLRNVRSVDKFALDFYVSGEPWTLPVIRQLNAGNALVNALGELFDVAARVCRSVMVRNGTALRAVLQKADKGAFQKGLSWSITRLFASDHSARRSHNSIHDPRHPLLPPTATTTKGALRVLEISSVILLSSPFVAWTIQSLNANDVTDLVFGTIEYREVDWHTLLSQLHVPALKSISFRGYTPFDALVNFMSRHRAITKMTLNNIDMDDWFRRAAATSAQDSLSKLVKAFKNIKKLACCPQGLVLLLSNLPYINSNVSSINLFPNLQSISVLWSVGIGQQLKMSVVGKILAPLAQTLKSYENISFVVTYRDDGNCPREPPNIIPPNGLSPCPPTSNADPNIPNTMIRSQTSATPYSAVIPPTSANPSSLSTFALFNEIRIELTSKADKSGIPDLVRNLAESFKRIKYIRIDTRLRTGKAPEENKVWKMYLCHYVLQHFGQLNVVFVDGIRTKVVGRED